MFIFFELSGINIADPIAIFLYGNNDKITFLMRDSKNDTFMFYHEVGLLNVQYNVNLDYRSNLHNLKS